MTKIRRIGIIAEDNCDVEAFKKLIIRITKIKDMTFNKMIGHGCSRIRKKAGAFAKNLEIKGCHMLLLVHDLDRKDKVELKEELVKSIQSCKITYKYVCIPIEEIEAWFLSDLDGIYKIFNVKRRQKISNNPESISSPKEKLENIIYYGTNKEKNYRNTKHNMILADKLSIELMKKKCKSFNEFYAFIKGQKYS